MKFVGNIYKEESLVSKEGSAAPQDAMRGSLNFIPDNGEAPGTVRYFKSFEELKKILEDEYGKKVK